LTTKAQRTQRKEKKKSDRMNRIDKIRSHPVTGSSLGNAPNRGLRHLSGYEQTDWHS
jgi:hypothetical protein